MGYSDKEIQLLHQAAMMHDLGKVAIPDSILLNPEKLNSLEFNLIKEHVTKSYTLLKKIPMFNELADIVLDHHERHDGHGYPNGKKGDEILPLSRIMIVADAFDAMTTNRIYKGRKNIPAALNEIQSLSGKQFHPDVVNAAINALKDVKIEQTISQLPKTALETERFSYFFKDIVSDTYNRTYLDIILKRNKHDKEYTCINIIYLHNFSAYNDHYGWHNGDKLLKDFASFLKKNYTKSLLFRVHGDDFILLDKEHMEVDATAINTLNLLSEANITASLGHYNLLKKDIKNMNSMDRHLLSLIAEL